MADLNKLIDSVAVILEERQPPTEEALLNIVKAQAAVLALTAAQNDALRFSDDDLNAAVRALEARFSIRMTLGSMFEGEDYRPWLIGRQGEIDWFYWER